MYKKASTLLPTLALVLVTAAWGLTFPLIKDSIQAISPIEFMAIRFPIAAFALFLIQTLFVRSEKKKPGELKAGAILGAFLFLGYALQTYGLQTTSSSKSGFLTGLTVLFVPLLSAVIDRKRLKASAWIGVSLSVIGLVLLSFPGDVDLGWSLGDTLTLLCAVAFASHILAISRFTKKYSPSRLTLYQISVCALLALSASIVSGDPIEALKVTKESPPLLTAILFCALFATAGAYWIQTAFQAKSTPLKTALIFSCEPVFAAFFSYHLYSENLNGAQALGCLALLLGPMTVEVLDALPNRKPLSRSLS
jgi:drug/metabolite transporter (DMT)-like permease